MAHPRDFAYLAASTRRSAALLRRGLREAGIEQGRRGSALAARVERALGGIEARIDEAESLFDEATVEDRSEYLKRMKLLNGWARFMHKAIPWASSAAAPPLDLGALYFVDEAGTAITQLDLDAIPNPADEFSTERRPFETLFPRLGLAEEEGPIPVILNFPALEVDSHLFLPLYGHELAHARVAEENLQAKVLDAHEEDRDLQDAFAKAMADVAKERSMSDDEAAFRLRHRLQRWTIELLCDQFAVQWLGPSFPLSFSAFLLALSWSEPLEKHPPTSLRIRHLLDYLTGSGWNSLLEQRAPRSFEWLAEVAARDVPAGDPEAEFLIEAATTVAPTVQAVVDEALGSAVYRRAEFDAVSAPVDELVAHETLPVQMSSGTAIDRRAILIVAWLSALEREDDATTLVAAPADRKTQAFFAKAIEMSAVLARWKEISRGPA